MNEFPKWEAALASSASWNSSTTPPLFNSSLFHSLQWKISFVQWKLGAIAQSNFMNHIFQHLMSIRSGYETSTTLKAEVPFTVIILSLQYIQVSLLWISSRSMFRGGSRLSQITCTSHNFLVDKAKDEGKGRGNPKLPPKPQTFGYCYSQINLWIRSWVCWNRK